MTTIELNHVSKIEGHAKLNINIEKNKLENLELEIFEGARFFKNILQNRKFDELPLITSRICGVCSPSHSLASIIAIEDAFDINPNKDVKLLRELLAIGGLLQSHALHLYFLVLPDYIGYDGALQMASKYKKEIMRALNIKRIGNKILNIIGGRDIHPITSVVGGFSKIPTKDDLMLLQNEINSIQDDAKKTFDLFSNLKYPNFEHKTTFMAIHNDRLLGDKISYLQDNDLKHFPHDFETYITEYFQHDSTAEFVVMEGKSYSTGAQARINVNSDWINKDLRNLIKVEIPNYSPFSNLLFQSFEIISSINRAKEILNELIGNSIDVKPPTNIKPKESTGIGVVEAPRGLLFQKYSFDEKGYCSYANVTTPTSQNLRTIEDCLKEFVTNNLHLSKNELIKETEKLIRSFDPCISCSSH